MKTGFKDSTAVKEGKKIKSPWNFDAPQYDQRSSCFVKAGTDYGEGHKQPVGLNKASHMTSGSIPFGRPNTLEIDHVHHGRVSNVQLDAE